MPTMPAGEPTMESLQQQIAALRRDLRTLQRKLQDEPVQPPKEDRIVYSHGSAPEEGKAGPPYRYRRPSGYLTSVEVSVGTPGSTQTTLRVFKKPLGSNTAKDLATVVLAKDDDYEMADDLMSPVEELDRVFVIADEVGTGMEDVTITLVFLESVG